jgi:predicted adenylyl cyclase CyaB
MKWQSQVLEIERKARICDKKLIIEKLKQINCELSFIGEFLKEDIYFAPQKIKNYDDLKKQKTIFRVRRNEENYFLTFKEKTLVDNTEVNKEWEINVFEGNIQELKEFFNRLGISFSNKERDELVLLKTAQEWVEFFSRRGYFLVLMKSKKTQLFKGTLKGQTISFEINEIKNLGDFLEVEIICQNNQEVAKALESIREIFSFLKIDKKSEEPRLYLELLFLNNRQESLKGDSY